VARSASSKTRATATSCSAAASRAARLPLKCPSEKRRCHRGRRSRAALLRRGDAFRARILHEEEFFQDIDDGEDGNSSLHRPARAGGALASTSLAPNFTSFPGFWPGPAGAPGGPGAAGESFGISPEPMHGASGSTVAAEPDACFSRVRFSNASLLGGDGHDDSLTSPAAAARQPSANAAVSSFELTFLHANIRSFGFKSKTKSAEIKRLIERSGFPTFVFFTETWLDKSSEELSLEG